MVAAPLLLYADQSGIRANIFCLFNKIRKNLPKGPPGLYDLIWMPTKTACFSDFFFNIVRLLVIA